MMEMIRDIKTPHKYYLCKITDEDDISIELISETMYKIVAQQFNIDNNKPFPNMWENVMFGYLYFDDVFWIIIKCDDICPAEGELKWCATVFRYICTKFKDTTINAENDRVKEKVAEWIKAHPDAFNFGFFGKIMKVHMEEDE